MSDAETELLKLKKKKLKKVFVITDDEQVSVEKYVEDIEEKIVEKMKKHIGFENAISSFDLFKYVYSADPLRFNSFKRFYYWSIIKKCAGRLRMSGRLFIRIVRFKVFVLKTQKEVEDLKLSVKNTIVGLNRMTKIAEDWVKDEKWKEIK